MNLEEARRIFVESTDDDLSPQVLEAVDVIEASDLAAEATRDFRCPTCGAKQGVLCEGGTAHKRRVAKLKLREYAPGSVWDAAAGAPYTSRARH